MHVSSLQEEGIMEVRNAACEQLLMLRISNKMANRKSRSILDKLQIVQPKPRDNMVRGECASSSGDECNDTHSA